MKTIHLISLLLKYKEAFIQIVLWYKKNPLLEIYLTIRKLINEKLIREKFY